MLAKIGQDVGIQLIGLGKESFGILPDALRADQRYRQARLE